MNILFIFPRELSYNSQSVRKLPSGGTEKAVIFLGEALQKLGHDVTWVTTLELVDKCVHYGDTDRYDVVISQEAELLQHFPKAQKVFWSHHFADQPISIRSAPFVRCFADKVVTLSQCHYDNWKAAFKVDSAIIGHGVWMDELITDVPKDPYRLIYASTPFRGLAKIPALFRQIKEKEPKATIAICSSMGTYGTKEKDVEYKALFSELAEIEGVELKGALNQKQLYREYAKANVFFYPNTWPETYCLALDEALAHGCTPVVTNKGALPERVDIYVEEIDGFIDSTLANLPNQQGEFLVPTDWSEVAKNWETVLNANT